MDNTGDSEGRSVMAHIPLDLIHFKIVERYITFNIPRYTLTMNITLFYVLLCQFYQKVLIIYIIFLFYGNMNHPSHLV